MMISAGAKYPQDPVEYSSTTLVTHAPNCNCKQKTAKQHRN